MYLLDSNVLIEAKNRYYAFDIAPGFGHGSTVPTRKAWRAASKQSGTNFSLAMMNSLSGRGNTQNLSEH